MAPRPKKLSAVVKKSMSSVQHVRLPIFFFAFLFGSAECIPYHTEYILGISSDNCMTQTMFWVKRTCVSSPLPLLRMPTAKARAKAALYNVMQIVMCSPRSPGARCGRKSWANETKSTGATLESAWQEWRRAWGSAGDPWGIQGGS